GNLPVKDLTVGRAVELCGQGEARLPHRILEACLRFKVIEIHGDLVVLVGRQLLRRLPLQDDRLFRPYEAGAQGRTCRLRWWQQVGQWLGRDPVSLDAGIDGETLAQERVGLDPGGGQDNG